jgi:hypothetical protein
MRRTLLDKHVCDIDDVLRWSLGHDQGVKQRIEKIKT